VGYCGDETANIGGNANPAYQGREEKILHGSLCQTSNFAYFSYIFTMASTGWVGIRYNFLFFNVVRLLLLSLKSI
jgi:hypothetical protein